MQRQSNTHTHTYTQRQKRARAVEAIISQRQLITARVFCTKRESESVRERVSVSGCQWSLLQALLPASRNEAYALSLSLSRQAVRAYALLYTSCSRLNKQTDGVGASVTI